MFLSGGERCEEGLTVGTEIGMSFRLPPVKDSNFGSAEKLCGVIPLLLPYGHYNNKQPTLLDDPQFPQRLDEFVRQKLPEYIELFPDDLDEVIMAKMKGIVRTVVLTYPNQDFDTPHIQIFISMLITAAGVDDMYDNLSEIEKPDYSVAKNTSEVIRKVLTGVIKSPDEAPLIAPALEPIIHYLIKMTEPCFKLVPGYLENNQAYIIAGQNAMRGNILLRYKERDGQISFSSGGRSFFGGYQNGTIQIIELRALLAGIQLDDKIRLDILFQKLLTDMGIASYAMNDVYGIVRDIKKNLSRDSNILIDVVDKGILLQDAFDISLKSLTDALNDAKIAIKLLKQYYSDDQQLLNYISILQEVYDGEIYAYAGFGGIRYGETNSKIVAFQ